MGRAGGADMGISLQGSWSDALLEEALRSKLSRGRSNSADRETYYSMVSDLKTLAEVARDTQAPEREAAEGALYGLSAAGPILMSLPAADPDELLELALDPIAAAQGCIAAAENELKQKRSDAEAREKLRALYERYRDAGSAFERAYANALVAAAAALGGLDSGDPKQLVASV